MKNLIDGVFPGRILPVNLKHNEVHGYPAYSSVAELESGVDLVVIATPIHTVPKIVEECGERKIGGAIVISAGGKEVGRSGIEIEEKMTRVQVPRYCCWMGGKSIEQAVEFLNGSGIPTFATPERAIRAYLHMLTFVGNRQMLLEVPPKLTRNITIDRIEAEKILTKVPKDGFLADTEVLGLLAAYGFPVIKSLCWPWEKKWDLSSTGAKKPENIGCRSN